MPVDEGKYAAIIAALGGGGDAGPAGKPLEPLGGPNLIDPDQDLGRGPGSPGGGRNPRLSGVRPSGRGLSGQGYAQEDVSDILRGMPPERVAAIQRQMVTSGLLPEGFRSYGFVDKSTRGAFAEVLEVANGQGANYATTLDEAERNGKAYLDELRRERARQRLTGQVSTYTDALSLEEQLQASARQNLGRKLRPNEVSKFVALYQGVEKGFKATAASMQAEAEATGTDATLEEIPSAAVAAEQFMQANYAQEAAGQSAYSYLGALKDLLGA